jgi:diguanylate cyclase (GGDEF)-like protein
MNPAGQLSEEGIHDFSVLPPWYRTRMAYLGYLLALLAFLAGVSRWRSAALNSRNRELMQLVALRTAELSQANQALHRANESLSDLSLTDALTGLRNRRNLVEHIDEDIAAMRRACAQARANAAESPASYLHFLMIDIDHFKQINDNHGHAAGDRVLEQFGDILRKLCRDEDTAVRWGGEEFMLMTRSTDSASGASIAERIRSQVASHVFQIDTGKTLRRTCSIGFAGYAISEDAPEQCSWEVAVRLADQCLYEAKRGGRNGWVGVRPADRLAASADELGDLAMAIENGYLELMKMPGRPGQQAVA